MNLTVKHLIELFKEIPLEVSYDYVSGVGNKARLVSIDEENERIQMERISKTGDVDKTTYLNSDNLHTLANKIKENTPITIDFALNNNGNTRSVYEAILIRTSEFYKCKIGNLKHIVWIPSKKHVAGELHEINPNEIPDFEQNNTQNAVSSHSRRNKDVSDFEINVIISSILSTGLIYSDTLIKRLAYSLMAKPFVILSGLAGSGKTQLALVFAKCLSENIEEQVCTVSIGADWTNREPLLGYPNALKNDEYVKPESGVLQLLMRANADPTNPYFLILDEMNLSVVERYFADFLSAMESGEPIKLWDHESEDVPQEILLPKNVFIIGTINVDETTYMFSPKVLDRANVIEFKIAADEMDEYLGKKVNINRESAYSACADMAVDFVNKAKSQVEKDDKNKDVLLSFFRELKKVNAEFGYRTVNEISRYLHFANGDLEDDAAMDTAILQKLLPKLHGSRKKLVPVLTAMWKLCLKDGITKEIEVDFSKDDFKYPESAEKIQRMYHAVIDNGFTSFAEA